MNIRPVSAKWPVGLLLIASFTSVRADLVQHWALDEISGLRVEDAISGGEGRLVLFETSDDSQWVSGRFNGALDLGTDFTFNNHIEFNVDGMDASVTGGFTVAMWINPGDAILKPAEFQRIATPGDLVGFTIMNNTFEGRVHDRVLLFWDGDIGNLNVGTTTLEPGTWYHVAITSTGIGGEKKYYVNGVLEEQRMLIPSQPGADGVHPAFRDGWGPGVARVGAVNGVGDRGHDSIIDDVRIYDEALDASDLLDIVNRPPPSVTLLTPDRGDPFHVSGDGVQFEVAASGGATVSVAGIRMELNGVDVTGGLQIGGTETLREVEYDQLAADSVYSALIEATDSQGLTARRRWTFGTLTPEDDLTLVHHYRLDEPRGLVALDSAGGRNASLFNFEDATGAQWVAGEVEGALDFGSDDTLNNFAQAAIDAVDSFISGGFTVAMWVQPGQQILTPGEYQLFDAPGGTVGFTIMNDTRDGILHDRVLLFWDGSLPDLHVGTTTLEPGNWYHVAITSPGPGGEKRYYVNGLPEQQTLFMPSQGGVEGFHPATSPGWTAGVADIGGFNGANRTHDSVIDDLRIYSVVLEEEDIQALVGAAPPEPLAVTNFVPLDGDLFHDASQGLQFDIATLNAGATIAPDNIKLTLNGVDVSADLTIAGSVTVREILYDQLVPGILYDALIEATDSRGGGVSRRVTFGTFTRTEEGLRHHYRLDETTGLIAADSVLGADATLVNFENDDDSQWVGGQDGGALDFGVDATNDNYAEMNVPALDSDVTGGFSIAMWLKPGEAILFPGEYQLLSTPEDQIGFTIMNAVVDGLVHDRVLLFWDGDLAALHVGTTTLEPGTWYHVAITSTGPGGQKKYYVNGLPEEQRLFSPALGGVEGDHVGTRDGWPAGIARIGAIRLGERTHGSVIDDLRIYDTALTDEEVRELAPENPLNISNLVPDAGELFHDAALGFQFDVSTSSPGGTIDPGDIRVVLNGLDVSAELDVGGGASAREVEYSGLEAGVLYEAEIEVTDSAGAFTSLRHSFGTLVRTDEPGLLHHFKLDETRGMRAGDSASGVIARLRNFDNGDDSQWVAGVRQGGLDLAADATNDNFLEAEISPVSALGSGGFTVAMWLNPGEAIRNTGEYQLFNSPGNTVGFTIMNNTIDAVVHDRVLLFWDGDIVNLHVGSTTLEPGTWYHVAITSSGGGGDKRYYVNGVEEEQRLFMPSQGGQEGFHPGFADGWGAGTGTFGALGDTTRAHGSVIDDVRIYEEELSAARIAQLAGGAPVPEDCDNGTDDDGDGDVDCDDTDCAEAPNCPTGGAFVRGDANADSAINITDAIYLLSSLFLGGPPPPCTDAADVNDDSAVNITDAIYLLSSLFLGGPPAPGPSVCGDDPTADGLDCASFFPCEP